MWQVVIIEFISVINNNTSFSTLLYKYLCSLIYIIYVHVNYDLSISYIIFTSIILINRSKLNIIYPIFNPKVSINQLYILKNVEEIIKK